jgi:pilus assembly protein Flp/PilA
MKGTALMSPARRRRRRDSNDRGASAVEYGLMVAAIAAVVVGIVFGLGTVVKDTFTQTAVCIQKVQNGPNCSK